MMIGGYTLDVYCDHPQHVHWRDGHHPGQFVCESAAGARKLARAAGWKLGSHKGGRDLCPLHRGAD